MLVFPRVRPMVPNYQFHPSLPLAPLDFLDHRNFQLWLTSKFYHLPAPHRFRPSGVIDLPRPVIVNLA